MVTEEGRLRIAAAGAETVGDYQVIASNAWGTLTSRPARLRMDGSGAPEIVVAPRPIAVRYLNPLVLTVVAVGEPPLSFTWFQDGRLVTSDSPDATVFLRSNALPETRGWYHVAVSNRWGVATSAPVYVAVHWDTIMETVLPHNAEWLYQTRDLLQDAGWQTNGVDDASWRRGVAPFGGGFPDVTTPLADPSGALPAQVCFLRPLVLEDLRERLQARIRYDDGVVLSLNGIEVARLNVGQDGRLQSQVIQPVVGMPNQSTVTLPSEWLHPGTNWLAVQLFQYQQPLAPLGLWSFDTDHPQWSSYDGTLTWSVVGTGIVTAAGRWLGCVSNIGSATSWLELPDRPELRGNRPFTIGGWFAWHYGVSGTVPAVAVEKAGEYRLYYSGPQVNRYRFRLGSVEVQEQTPGTRAGQWRLVIAWFDGTHACIQMDNGPIYKVPASVPDGTTNPLVALRLSPGAASLAMDELFFFPRVLSNEERSSLYLSGIQTFITNLTQTGAEDLWFDLQVERLRSCPPQFLDPPKTLVGMAGETATLELTLLGSVPITYQWFLEGRPLPDATNHYLRLAALTDAQSGRYTLVASNAAGVATSPPIRLTVVSKPRLLVHRLSEASGWSLLWPPLPIASTLEASTNLVHWFPLWSQPPNSAATNWPIFPNLRQPTMFYRLQLRP